MYICICNAVNESAIQQAVENGVTSFRDLSFTTGCGLQCGSCVKLAREVLDRELEKKGEPASSVKLEFVSSS
ncbi:bacterioferritin-associated ferredoxin [Pseudomonadota bacterium]